MPPTPNKTRKLTPRNYLGEGYFHWFINNETGEVVSVETTKAQYESMGIKGEARNNPTLTGHTWESSSGGTTKVDTPSGFLGEDEYTVQGDKIALRIDGVESLVPLDVVDVDHILDESRITR